MKSAHRSIAFVAFLAAVACSDGATAPKETFETPPKPLPTLVGYALVPDGAAFRLGEQFLVQLVKQMSDGSRIPVLTSLFADPNAPRLQFISFNPSIITLNPITGNAVAVGPGSARIEARLNNEVMASTVLTVAQPNGVTSNALVIHEFWMIEYQYPSGPPDYYYAPQFSMSATPGRSVTILTLQLTIPGFYGSITFSCGGNIDSTPTLLNGEVYGDWTFAVSSSTPATNVQPKAVVTFADDTGATGTATITGTVVQGTFPDTYSGGRNGGPCFHGYRG